MKNQVLLLTMIIISVFVINSDVKAQAKNTQQATDSIIIPASDKLAVIWTSGDKDVALKMVFMYTYNAGKYGWWDDITLVVWGPSAKLLTEDKELQDYLGNIIETGTSVIACKGCSDQYGVSENLEGLGIEVAYIGKVLTDFVKEGRKILTF
jgi:hypothetical protein